MQELTFIRGLGHVAMQYGVEEAIFLDTIVFWARENKSRGENFRAGRWWTYNSIKGLMEIFPWWTGKQLRRIAAACVDKGALLTGNFNREGRDRTIWYSPSDALLALYGERWGADEAAIELQNAICPNGQMQMPKRENAFAQMGEPLPCSNYHDIITPLTPQEPEPEDANPQADPFSEFWAAYPLHKNKPRALKAWRKVNPGPGLFAQIMAALEVHKRSMRWVKDDGAYIPYPATWLNGCGWEDDPGPLCRASPERPAQEAYGWQ